MTPVLRCDIELLDRSTKPGVLVVQRIRINGQDVYTPKGTTFTITVGAQEACVVELRLMPTSLVIKHEEDADGTA